MTNGRLTEQEAILRDTVRDLADRELAPRAAGYDRDERYPAENVSAIAALGLFGLTIEPEFGGSGGTTRQLAIVSEELSRGCAATGTIYGAHLSLCTRYIDRFGSGEQRAKYVPGLASGNQIGAFALTEAEAGSDAAAIKTIVRDDGDGFSITGTKMFITNGEQAATFVVMATRNPALGAKGIETFIVERDFPGITVTPQHGKMGIRASSTCDIRFEDVAVPSANRIGGPGEGFGMTMQVLDAGRVVIAAQGVGIAQAALEASISYAKERKTFGRPIADRQAVRWMIADSATQVEAARQLTYRAASLQDSGEPFATTASMAKLFSSRAAVECADRAVQIHGGAGYFAPTTVERLYRDAKITEIYEGTSEIQRLVIARRLLGDQ
jgi:alkylation response protein AidB-like acyl-CoA dehydrogenase